MQDADEVFLHRAYLMALKSADEGGVPVGACLTHRGALVSQGHNRRQQEQTIILHGETDCLRQAGLYGHWHECTLYTSLSPCMMCAGTIVQFRIPRVVIADASNFGGNEEFLRSRGVEVVVRDYPPMIAFFARWKAEHPEIWHGDIGV